MIAREQIETILTVNGIDPTAPDEEIKTVLLEARWQKSDVESALTVLRENNVTHKQKVDASHTLFHSDGKLSPETITSLLGIKTEISGEMRQKKRSRAHETTLVWQMFTIVLLATILALVILLLMMWYNNVGFFHQTLGGHF